VDVTFEVAKATDKAGVNAALREAAEGSLKGILGYSEEPLVSIDYRGDDRSSIVDGSFTRVIGGHLVKVLSWYDNEWGYSCRVRDLIKFMAEKGL
jgi:glyceraldehyde 3-phosphate dehydrogenase